ncbi:MAG: DUF364 domain-containing protein [bacterium]
MITSAGWAESSAEGFGLRAGTALSLVQYGYLNMSEAIITETLARLRGLHGPDLERIRIERAVAGIVFSGVKLSDGHGGMAGTPRPDSHPSPEDRQKPPPGALNGVPVLSLLEPFPQDPFRRSLAVAALNALSVPWMESGRHRIVYDRDALDMTDIRPGMSVTIVGAFHSYIDRLKSVEGLSLRVLELRKSAMREEDMPFYASPEKAQDIIPESDALIITGLAVANMTLEGLLRLAQPKASVVVVGPSGSMLPDALFRRNVSVVGGSIITDPDAALELLSQGAYARHLYGRCARRINLLKND